MNKLIIRLRKNQVHISIESLKGSKKKIAEVVFKEDRKLSKTLLPAIDKILKEKKLKLADLERIDFLDSDVDDTYTSYRIIKSSCEAINWSLEKMRVGLPVDNFQKKTSDSENHKNMNG